MTLPINWDQKEIDKFEEVNSKTAVRVAGTNTDGSLDITTQNNGHICEDNTTDIPLGISEVFTGVWQDTLNYNNIIIGVIADEDSGTDGMEVQWSSDGITKHDDDVFTILANKGKVFTFTPARRYIRIVYTNGTTAQTSFNLQTIFKKGGIKASSHRIQDHIVAEDDAELVKAVLTGENPAGTFVNFQSTTAGNFKVSLEEYDPNFYTNPLPVGNFELLVSKGLIPGHTFINKFGQNDDLNSSTYEDIWDGGGTYVYPADGTAPIVKLIGHDAADTEPIEVQGLDVNGNLILQTKTLTGTTAVTLDTPLWRVFRLKNIGTSDLVADVCAINTGDTQDYACINNGNNQTLMALYTIPNGKTGYLYQGSNNLSGVTRAVAASGKLWMRPFGLIFQLKKTFGVNGEGSSFFALPAPIPQKIPAKTDIRVSAIGSANGVKLNTTFDILLVDD